jgi:hypothetical protein
MRALVRALLGLWCVALAAGGLAQTAPPPVDGPACPAATALRPADLYGLWRLVLWPEVGSASNPTSSGALVLGPHPEYAGSVRGRLRRSDAGADLEAEVAGDVDDEGVFVLDESADGLAIDAVWTGEPTDCGRRIQGSRRPAGGRANKEPSLRFLLQKATSTR